jgi:hypothetical protein
MFLSRPAGSRPVSGFLRDGMRDEPVIPPKRRALHSADLAE